MNAIYKIIILLFTISITSFLYPAETINKILATVQKISISELDFNKAEEVYKALQKNSKKQTKPKGSPRTQVMDFLIARSIIDITADEESIQVNEKTIEAEVDRLMKLSQSADRAQFEKILPEKVGLPFEVWYNELPYQMKKNQLIQVRVPMKPPTEAEIKNWYNQNIQKVGFEVKFREIIVVPKNGSFEEEQRISNEINSIKKDVKKDASSFNLIADGPRNQAPAKGRNDWMPSHEVYNKSLILLNIVGRMEEGMVSDVFRDEKNRYCIVRMEGKRKTQIDSIRRNIQEILQREKVDEAFEEWIAVRRKELHISIYDKEYITENKIEAPDESFNYTNAELNP